MKIKKLLNQPYRQPDVVILEIKDLIKELETSLKNIVVTDGEDVVTPDGAMITIVEDVIKSIRNEKDAELSLDYECLQIVKDALDSFFSEEVLETATSINRFGKRLLELIKYHDIYNKGYLSYKFDGLLGMDIILRIDPEVILAKLFYEDKHDAACVSDR